MTPPFLLIGNPGNRRLDFFQAALKRLGREPAQVIPYADLLAHVDTLPDFFLSRLSSTVGTVTPPAFAGDILMRIESPGENFQVTVGLIALGAGADDSGAHARIEAGAALDLSEDRGRILFPRQWFLGFSLLLRAVDRALWELQQSHHLRLRYMNPPADILAMFEKPVTHARLRDAGVPTPESPGQIYNYDSLQELIETTGRRRLFLKLSTGSSASGVLAYAGSPRDDSAIATTSVELVRQNGEIRLYNSLRLRRYSRERDLRAIIDTLGAEGLHTEVWVPKNVLRLSSDTNGDKGDFSYDLRILCVGGKTAHRILRLSRSPMTNLHLGNRRGDVADLRLDPEQIETMEETVRQAMALFPASLYSGVDLALTGAHKRPVILELNAFGDLLPGLLVDSCDTYELCLRSFL